MTRDLAGSVAIVTGGSKGIGRDIALTLARSGAKVAVCARDETSLRSVVSEICGTGCVAEAFPFDVMDSHAIDLSIKNIATSLGGIDILVNNAGGAIRFGGFLDLPDETWMQTYRLNVMSVVHCVRSALPYLRRSNKKRIINIASISGIEPGFFNPHYTSAKAAVINLGKYLANQFAAEGILINTVCVGPVHSAAWDRNVERLAVEWGVTLDEGRTRVEAEEAAKIPLRRVGEGTDVAGLVRFLTSEEASWITGSVFTVDGGKRRNIF